MQRTRFLPFLGQKHRLPLLGLHPLAFCFLAREILFFTHDTAQLLRQSDMMTVRLLSVLIAIVEHGASFKNESPGYGVTRPVLRKFGRSESSTSRIVGHVNGQIAE